MINSSSSPILNHGINGFL